LGSIYSSAAGAGSENKHPARRHRALCAPRTVLRATTRHKPTHPCHRSDGRCPPGAMAVRLGSFRVGGGHGHQVITTNIDACLLLFAPKGRPRSLRSLPRFPSPPSPEGLCDELHPRGVRKAAPGFRSPRFPAARCRCAGVGLEPATGAEIVQLLEGNPGMRARIMIRRFTPTWKRRDRIQARRNRSQE
jgi:hypothetical protein